MIGRRAFLKVLGKFAAVAVAAPEALAAVAKKPAANLSYATEKVYPTPCAWKFEDKPCETARQKFDRHRMRERRYYDGPGAFIVIKIDALQAVPRGQGRKLHREIDGLDGRLFEFDQRWREVAVRVPYEEWKFDPRELDAAWERAVHALSSDLDAVPDARAMRLPIPARGARMLGESWYGGD